MLKMIPLWRMQFLDSFLQTLAVSFTLNSMLFLEKKTIRPATKWLYHHLVSCHIIYSVDCTIIFRWVNFLVESQRMLYHYLSFELQVIMLDIGSSQFKSNKLLHKVLNLSAVHDYWHSTWFVGVSTYLHSIHFITKEWRYSERIRVKNE